MNQQSTGPAREFRAVEKLTGGEHVNHQAHQGRGVIAVATTSKLLADPAQIALIRDLIGYARQHRVEHATYSFGNGLGQPMAPREHTWTLGPQRVSYEDGCLRFLAHRDPVLKVRTSDARQVADLLAAIGVLPFAFASAYRTGRSDAAWIANVDTNPDRKCRYCGATSGLTMVRGDVLELTPMQWQCWDDCKDSAR